MAGSNDPAGYIDLMIRLVGQNLNRQVNSMATSVGGLAKKAFAAVGVTMGTAAMVSFTKKCIELGSNLAEVQNVVDNSFKSMSGSVNEFAKNAITDFGLSETVAKKYMGTIGAMNNAFGFTEKQSLEMAKAVTGLAGDVASFYNLSSDDAFTKLKAIWTGETEGLKDLGVVMTQTSLDEYALNNGFGKTTAKMTEQEKVMLRFQYTTNALNTAAGDFVRTQDGWANQTRVLTLRFESLKATLGQGFINLFTPILKAVNQLIARLQVLAEGFLRLTEVITGRKVAEEVGSIAASAADATENISGMGDAAVESAKKATKSLAGFDMLNNLTTSEQEDSGPEASALINIPDTGGLLQKMEDSMTNLSEAAEKMAERIKDIISDFAIGDYFSAGEDVSHLVAEINDFITRAVKNVDWEGIGEDIGNFISGIDWEEIFQSAGELIGSLGFGLLEFWSGIFKEAPLETVLTTAIGLALTLAGGKGYSLGQIAITIASVNLALEGGFSFGKILGDLLLPDEAKESREFAKEFGFWDTVKYLFTITPEEWSEIKNDWDAGFSILKEGWETGMSKIGSDLSKWWSETELKGDIDEFTGAWTTGIETVGLKFEELTGSWRVGWDSIEEQAEEVWDEVDKFFKEALSEFWNKTISPWFTKEKWLGIFNNIKNALKEVWNAAVTWWNNMAFVKWWNQLKTRFSGDNWKKMFTGIKTGLVGAWENAINGIKQIWNKFASWMNSRLTFTMPEFKNPINGESIGGQTIKLGEVPQFATGGIVDTPTLAMIGEAGKEAVVPLENNTGWISKLADEVAKRGGGSGRDYTAILLQMLDVMTSILDKEGLSESAVYEAVLKQNRTRTRQLNYNPLI